MHAENLREHRKGLLVDMVTDVNVGNDTAWHQVTTFLHQQRTSLSDEPKPPPQKQPKLAPPNAVLRITPGQIRRYAVGRRRPQPDPHQLDRAPSCSASRPSSRTECSAPQQYWRTSKVSCPTR